MLVTLLLNKRRDKSSREAYVKPEVARHEVHGSKIFPVEVPGSPKSRYPVELASG